MANPRSLKTSSVQIEVVSQTNYGLVICIEGQELYLTYKGFGGKQTALKLGAEGIVALLCRTKNALARYAQVEEIYPFFQVLGCENAMKLADAAFPDVFSLYWRALAQGCKNTMGGCSFRLVLQTISGTNSTLGHCKDNAFVMQLQRICKEAAAPSAMNRPPHNNSSLLDIRLLQVISDGVAVSFSRKVNNSVFYMLNGTEIPTCQNGFFKTASTDAVLRAAIEIKKVVVLQGNLKPLTEKYGGSFVFRVLHAVCPQQAVAYFIQIAEDGVKKRASIEPHKILEDLNFAFNASDIAAFIDEILSTMEAVSNEMSGVLLKNREEILSAKSVWNLFYERSGKAKRLKIDFDDIAVLSLRMEVQDYLRDRWVESPREVEQFVEVFYLLRDGLNAWVELPILSIAEANPALVQKVKSHLEKISREEKASKNISYKIKQTMIALRRMYGWSQCKLGNKNNAYNPFNVFELPHLYSFRNRTVPADDTALRLIIEHFYELPEVIQLAFKLMTMTLARSCDITGLKVSALAKSEDKKYLLRIKMSKTGKPITFEIRTSVALELLEYIEKTNSLRESMGSDYIFVYERSGFRNGTKRRPEVLDNGKFLYQLNKLLKKCSGEKQLHITAKQIRAEGSRREAVKGRSNIERALQLGNKPTTADRHYNNPVSHLQLYEEARRLEWNFEAQYDSF